MKKSLRILLSVILMVAVTFANTQGPSGGTGAGASWTNPTNIATTNAVYATCPALTAPCAGKLSSSTFGFSIPVGATINGITVAIVAHCQTANLCEMTNTNGGTGICVTKTAATCTGTSKLDATTWPATDTTFTEGSGADLWGTTWAVSDINATGFGAMIDPEVTGGISKTMSVDSILITVTFTPAAATSSSGFLKMFGYNKHPFPQTQTRSSFINR